MLDTGRIIPVNVQSDPSIVNMQATTVKNHAGHDSRMGFRNISIKFGYPAMFIAAIAAYKPNRAFHSNHTNMATVAPIAHNDSLYDQVHLPLTNRVMVTNVAPTVHAPGNHPGLLAPNVVTSKIKSKIVHIRKLAGV